MVVGPPGPPGKTPVVGLTPPLGSQIAFYIGLSQNIEQLPAGDNCPLIFDTVILNLGGFYNATDGVFTTKVSGVYSFLLVVSARSYEKVRGKFKGVKCDIAHVYFKILLI